MTELQPDLLTGLFDGTDKFSLSDSNQQTRRCAARSAGLFLAYLYARWYDFDTDSIAGLLASRSKR